MSKVKAHVELRRDEEDYAILLLNKISGLCVTLIHSFDEVIGY